MRLSSPLGMRCFDRPLPARLGTRPLYWLFTIKNHYGADYAVFTTDIMG